MVRRSFSVEQILALLRESPDRIAELTSGLTADQLETRPSPDKWSAVEVLAHLRACADVWGDCIALIIAEDSPTIKAINPKRWIKSTNYGKLKFRASFRAFSKQRTELLAVLDALPLEGWSRKAIVTGAGSALERTVLKYGAKLAVHERAHWKQFKRIASALR